MEVRSWLLSLVVAGLSVAVAGAADPPRRPNFLVVLADNVGQDWFGCYGSDEGCTPRVDRLAAEGVRFRHCYVTPLCSTTRAEFYTGRYGLRTGWHTHHDAAIYGGGGFDWRRETTWARVLHDAGYATAITGKWQINDLSVDVDALRRHGFAEHLVWTGMLEGRGDAEKRWQASIAPGGNRELESRYWDPIVYRNGVHEHLTGSFGPDVYVDYLIDFMRRNRERPFVAYYAMPLVHIPTVTTPTSPDAAAPEREKFAGMVRYLDRQIGRLVDELDAMNLRNDTIVLFMTDNGTSRNLAGGVGGKRSTGGLGTLTEGGLDVPLIVNGPTRIAEGVVSSALVDASDVFPTLLELAGVSAPTNVTLDGRSFAAQIDRRTNRPAGRDWIFAQYADVRVVRDQRFKLFSTGQLYDLANDPGEKQDLSAQPVGEAAAARTRLQAVLDGLPANVNLPFEPRSSSAFKLRAESKQTPSK